MAIFDLLLILFALQSATAQTPAQRLKQLFTERPIPAGWFAPTFLQQVSTERVSQIIAQLTQQYGAFEHVEGEGGAYQVVLERAVVPTRITLDAEGRIMGLFFSPRIQEADELLKAFAPHNRPFLSTREAFILKNPANQDLARRFLKADEAGPNIYCTPCRHTPARCLGIFRRTGTACHRMGFLGSQTLPSDGEST
ncbi:MAG: hypothetical protein Q9M35_12905 [Rhodothermus sp.]|nr:hypothetical protein [Rhodothermus sp.]